MYINLTWNCRVCVGVAFLCLLWEFLPSLTSFGVNWPTTRCENKDEVRFFTLKFECNNGYKLLLCKSENVDIACCNKNNWEWGFCVFQKKRTNTCFFSKNIKVRIKKGQKAGRVFFFPWKRFFLNPDIIFQSFL